jgi:DNA polymerase I-like protein with 3'-5' exonuclease and polymerase domains
VTLVFDIETDGLLLDVSRFWVGVTYCIETKEENVYYDAKEMVKALNEAETIIGHNIVGYDIPALYILTGENCTSNVIDTLLLAKLAYYDKDKSWSHSLDAYGERLGCKKGHHSDWTKYSKEMEGYCKQDVKVTHKLYQHLKRKTPWLPPEALQLEQDVQRIVIQQYIDGWKFDIKKAKELHVELVSEKEEAEATLLSIFTPKFLPKGKTKIPKKQFTRLGITTCGEHQPIALTDFNPGSGNHIVWWVDQLYGKQKWKLTEKKNPKTDADTLVEMFSDKEWATPLLHYMEVTKLLGQLAEGDKAWLKQVHKDGRLHGGADILGAVTGRFTHNNPNLAQVPSVRAYKGAEARSLFTVEKDCKLIGCDASGLELRTLSHYLARYDGGTYGKILLESDIHTANQEAAGLPTRDNAKTFIYGFLYGAGDEKIGKIVDGTKSQGKALKGKFLSKTKGLKQLSDDVKKAAKRGYLRGLTGRRLYVRSPHSALNTLLQSAGAYVMKYYVVELDRKLRELGADFRFVGNIHDEVQIEVKESWVDVVVKEAERAFQTVTEQLGFRCLLEGEAKVGDNWYGTH